MPRPGNFEVGSNKAVVVDKVPLSPANVTDEDSWLLFKTLDIQGDWLEKHPQEWRHVTRRICENVFFVTSLKVTNDTVES